MVVSPQIDGENVTFGYGSLSAKNVALVGDWSEEKIPMTEVEDIFSVSTILKPGVYHYYYVVDGENKVDSSNRFKEDGESVLYMPGLVGGQVNVVKGETTALPMMLTEVGADGTQKQTTIETYEVSTEEAKSFVTLDSGNVTVSAGYTGEQ